VPTDGSDFIGPDYCSSAAINAIKNNFYGASAPASPANGVLWIDSDDGLAYIYVNGAWVAAASAGAAPVGSILASCPGYFGNGSNGSYTRVLGTANTVAAVNTYINPYGWYVCDGAAVNVSGSLIWNAASRYVPNLTDDRFTMGDTAAGSVGGANVNDHVHTANPAVYTMPATTTTQKYGTVSVAWSVPTNTHTHTVDLPNTTSGAASNTENRPLFLGLFYVVRVS
jgi:hypothetical protein